MSDQASTIDLSSLMDDGDTMELDDGRTLRLLIKPDDMDPFQADDFHGKIAPVERDRWNPYHNEKNRPDDFDGNAEKLSIPNNGGVVWWQPSPDGPKRGTPEFKQWRRDVLHLLEYGWSGVVLELLEGQDAYHRPIVTQTASLWAIDNLQNGYLAEVVSELAEELGLPQRSPQEVAGS